MNLQSLRGRGLRLAADGDRLVVSPKSVLTDELRAIIRANKEALLRELEAEAAGYKPADETVRARAARQARLEEELRAHPERRVAFDVVDAPLHGGPGEPISVVLAVRSGAQILSGEVRVPREQWNPALFTATVTEAAVRPS